MVFEEIKNRIYEDILEKLPSHLTYHNLNHTAYVLEKAVFLAEQSEVSPITKKKAAKLPNLT
jgi:uncharacterized protein